MKPRLAIVLLLLVTLPLGLMAWLGLRLVQTEKTEIDKSFHRLHLERLRDIEARLGEVISARERELMAQTASQDLAASSIRKRVSDSPHLRQIFVLDAQGDWQHPPLVGPISRDEKEFLTRAEQVFQDRSRFFQDSGEGAEAQDHGWYSWFWASGLNLVFWQRHSSGSIIGYELNRFRLIADLIATLPDDQASAAGPGGTRLALLGARGEALYKWGSYQAAEHEAPVALLDLGAPLQPWRLSAFAPPPTGGSDLVAGTWLLLVMALVAAGLLFIGLAVYFYRESSRDLREAGQRVSFVNHVSHELKTPLTNIRMYAELLQERLEDQGDKSQSYLDVVVSESQKLSRLIDNVLTFSRHRRGVLKIRRTLVGVDDIIDRVVQTFLPILSHKQISVARQAGSPKPAAIDADALEQILGNLLSNVEKYAPGGKVELRSQQSAGLITITVRDEGPGVAAGARERIFQPFVRLGAELTEGVAGTGIGLAIARELARLHGGDLICQPAASGATFVLTLATETGS